jgi:hypothetical protein
LTARDGDAAPPAAATAQGDFIFEKCCTISFNLKKPGSP